jgi:hypothetical protein
LCKKDNMLPNKNFPLISIKLQGNKEPEWECNKEIHLYKNEIKEKIMVAKNLNDFINTIGVIKLNNEEYFNVTITYINDPIIQQRFSDIIKNGNHKHTWMSLQDIMIEIDHPDLCDFQHNWFFCTFGPGTLSSIEYLNDCLNILDKDYTNRLPNSEKFYVPHLGVN